MLRRRGNRLAILAQIEQQAVQCNSMDDRSSESGTLDFDNASVEMLDVDDHESDSGAAEFKTDFDEVELTQHLRQLQDEANLMFESNDASFPDDVIDTAQDEEFPTVDELQQLIDFQHQDGDPTEDNSDDELDPSEADYDDNIRINHPPAEHIDNGLQTLPCGLSSSRREWRASNTSEEIPHRRNHVLLSDFHMALGTWAQLNGITDNVYRGLREILQSYSKAQTIQSDIASLPACVSTLKKSIRRRLPLLQLRKSSIPLRAEKLSTARQSRGQGPEPRQDLYFFNTVEYLKVLILSDLRFDMYFGMALLVDDKDKIHPWHSRAWASSARSTSGQFACGRDGIVVIPSDFVEYYCRDVNCNTCRNPAYPDRYHKGRVTEVWKDERSQPYSTKGAVILMVEPMLSHSFIMDMLKNSKQQFKGYPNHEAPNDEWVLLEDSRRLIAEGDVVRLMKSVYVDYAFGSSVDLPTDLNLDAAVPRPAEIVIRRKVNTRLRRFIPIVQSAPVRGELEVQEFGRGPIIEAFHREDRHVYSVPLILFADGFGLYRTMYKSIMGIYHSIACLKRSDRLRQMNVMPVTLGPHGSNDDDVWMQIGHYLREAENGITIDLHSRRSFVHAHVLMLAGDFPQQQENSGFRRPTAKQGCRMCDVTLDDRGDLSFDLSSGEHQRHHHEIMRQRALLNSQTSKAGKERVANAFGLALDNPVLANVLPALDIIKTRPADTAHSELGGLTKMIHLILIDQVLTPAGNTEYSKVFRLFPLYPGWGRIQSPHHVLQYSLVEHGRWSVIIPVLLRTWLRANPKYMKPSFRTSLMKVFEKDIKDGMFGPTVPDATDILVKILVSNVTTNIILTTDRLPEKYRNGQVFDEQIKQSRRLFQMLCRATSDGIASRRSRSMSFGSDNPFSRAVMALPTVASGNGAIATGPSAVSAAVAIQSAEEIEDPRLAMETVEMTTAKSTKYKLWMSRPNVHIGLHYRDVVEEYGLASLPMVIMFEIKHKMWKKLVYTTNHRSPEKDLFAYENIAQTLRFLIHGSYRTSDPELTEQIRMLHVNAPSVFLPVLRSGDVLHHDPNNADNEEEEAYDLDLIGSIQPHKAYVDPTPIGEIKPQVCRQRHRPTKESQMDSDFKRQLADAYAREYQRQNVTIVGSGQRIDWWKGVAWSVANDEGFITNRTTKRRGQYIRYFGGFARINGIFTHSSIHNYDADRIFMVISPVTTHATQPLVDDITGLDIYTHQKEQIIGLPAVLQEPLYMVPFKENDKGDWTFVSDFDNDDETEYRLLHINWNVGFM